MAYPVVRSKHRVSRGYTALHKAYDIAPLKRGTPELIYAVGKGRISHVGLGSWRAGKNIALQLDGDNSIWWYTHLSTIGSCRVGQTFRDGDELHGAKTGNTGFSFGVHLHIVRFARGILDNFSNPWPFIKTEPSPETYGKAASPAPTKPKPSSPNRTLRVGALVRLTTPWRRYKYSSLRGVMIPRNLRAGEYRVVQLDHGNPMLESITPGYVAQGWVMGSALVARGGVID